MFVGKVTSGRNDSWVEGYNKQQMINLQRNDPEIGLIARRMIEVKDQGPPTWEEAKNWDSMSKKYWEYWSDFRLCDGVLYLTNHDPWKRSLQLILPVQLRKGALQQLHDAKSGGHFGSEKTFARVRERFFWVGHCKMYQNG